jgi:hypothetical protein
MISIISDTSWISKHNKISQVTFKANVEKTIDKLVNKVIKKVKDKVTKEF